MARIVLSCETPSDLSVREVAEFLYDLTMLYDRLVMLHHQPNAPIIYSPEFYRRWRRLQPGQQLILTLVSMESPLRIEVRIDPAAVVAEVRRLLIAVLSFIRDWSHERRMQRYREEINEIVIRELRKRAPYMPIEALVLLAHDSRKLAESRIKVIEWEEQDE
jgi:hypothetical protein